MTLSNAICHTLEGRQSVTGSVTHEEARRTGDRGRNCGGQEESSVCCWPSWCEGVCVCRSLSHHHYLTRSLAATALQTYLNISPSPVKVNTAKAGKEEEVNCNDNRVRNKKFEDFFLPV